MQRKPDIYLLYKIARYYYVDGISQNEIAEKVNISRSQISRLLQKARDMGIVKVSVSIPIDLDARELAGMVEDALGLKKVIIAPVKGSNIIDDNSLIQAITNVASEFIPEEIKDCRVIGIGWGKTVYETSLQLSYYNERDRNHYFIPLIGISGNDNPNLQINSIIDRFSERFRSKGLFINIPAVRESKIPLSQIENARLENLKSLWNHIDAAIVGLGPPPEISENIISELSQEYKERVIESKTCGDILSQFYYEDGRILDYEEGYTCVRFDINRLKKVKKVICLAGGVNKVNGIITAAKCGFINTLVTDSITARYICERCESYKK